MDNLDEHFQVTTIKPKKPVLRRYFKKRDPETGLHQIHDRRLKVVLCSCVYKEQAELIELGMNAFEEGINRTFRSEVLRAQTEANENE